jgi:hypothetical protein
MLFYARQVSAKLTHDAIILQRTVLLIMTAEVAMVCITQLGGYNSATQKKFVCQGTMLEREAVRKLTLDAARREFWQISAGLHRDCEPLT